MSADPRYALFPAPRGCAGHRLWAMLHEVSGALRKDYIDGFDRRNLVTGDWTITKARAAAADFTSPAMRGRMVVLLGQQVARALGAPPVLVTPQPGVHDQVFRVVPHPSRRNLWYNDPDHRLVVGLLLEELLHGQVS